MTDLDQILTERRAAHGDFSEHARITQNLKAMAANGVNWRESRLTSVQREAIEMILHKVGRIVAGDPNHRDHWDDIAGYARLAADRTSQGLPVETLAAERAKGNP